MTYSVYYMQGGNTGLGGAAVRAVLQSDNTRPEYKPLWYLDSLIRPLFLVNNKL